MKIVIRECVLEMLDIMKRMSMNSISRMFGSARTMRSSASAMVCEIKMSFCFVSDFETSMQFVA